MCVWAETGKLGRQLVGVKRSQIKINPTCKTVFLWKYFVLCFGRNWLIQKAISWRKTSQFAINPFLINMLDTRIYVYLSVRTSLSFSVTLTVTHLDSKMGWTGELWSKTNLFNWQNYVNSFFSAVKIFLKCSH